MSINMMPYGEYQNKYNPEDREIIRFETDMLPDRQFGSICHKYLAHTEEIETLRYETTYIPTGKRSIRHLVGKMENTDIDEIIPKYSLKMRSATPAEVYSLYKAMNLECLNAHEFRIREKLKTLADQHLTTLMFISGMSDLPKDILGQIINSLTPKDTHLIRGDNNGFRFCFLF